MSVAHREIFVFELLTLFFLAGEVIGMHVFLIIVKQQKKKGYFEANCFAFPPPHTDELCHSMTIGRLYRVVGIPVLVHQWPSITWSVEANGVTPWEPQCKTERIS